MSRARQIPSPMNNLQGSVADPTCHRRDVPVKPRSMPVKPLLTHKPLPQAQDRAKKQTAQPVKRRKRPEPTKSPFSFDPKEGRLPSGKQSPPLSLPTFPRPPASDSSTSSFDEPRTTPLSGQESRDQPYDPHYECDAHKRPRLFAECPSIGQPTTSCPPTPCTDMDDMNSAQPEFYDSPVSCTSSSSPAPSDQSPTGAAPEFGAVQVAEYTRQIHTQMYPYDNHPYTQPTVAHYDSYSYAMDPCDDRLGQGYPMQFIGAVYPRAAPPDSDINSYIYPPGRC
ncbi:hypothetical protein PAXRUDRAFT_823954 [Paxillus rubicundulus Ve08.2h10]|uniref:Uncharacterized protein n=1 Tax=Paxillus rubicundulus Ve08.2h10 TaxID=930991 RepID=A0A0D0DUY7_9AGAM|nr:hypothetical protein PAXRUDRAFT_823954 [Paxillus rubicundulus Ve08.2h10]